MLVHKLLRGKEDCTVLGRGKLKEDAGWCPADLLAVGCECGIERRTWQGEPGVIQAIQS